MRKLLGMALVVAVFFAGYVRAEIENPPVVDLSSYAKTSQVPTPATGVPPGPFGAGTAAPSDLTYVPGTAAQRQGVQRATTTTAADGTFLINWNWTFVSSTPTVVVEAGNPGGTQPISCNWFTRSSSSVTGKCWQANTTLLNLSIVTGGLTLNVFGNPPAANTPISVISAEPTQ